MEAALSVAWTFCSVSPSSAVLRLLPRLLRPSQYLRGMVHYCWAIVRGNSRVFESSALLSLVEAGQLT